MNVSARHLVSALVVIKNKKIKNKTQKTWNSESFFVYLSIIIKKIILMRVYTL
jgi:hypothetical protein